MDGVSGSNTEPNYILLANWLSQNGILTGNNFEILHRFQHGGGSPGYALLEYFKISKPNLTLGSC